MVENTLNLPGPLLEEAKRYFHPGLIQQAFNHLKQARVAISFSSGRDPHSFFVVSGIVNDSSAYETKISFKRRLENTPEGAIASNCSCQQWTKERHCSHSIALYIYFKLEELGEEAYAQNISEDGPPLAINASFGVTPPEYGTIIKSPYQLEGAPSTATYSSLQYLLSSRKVIHFPIPKNFEGKLTIFIDPPKLSSAAQLANEELSQMPPEKQIEYYVQISFGHSITSEDDEQRSLTRVSLFENLYLFNWDTGVAYHLPKELKEFIQKIRARRHGLNPNKIMGLVQSSGVKDLIQIVIQGTPLEELPRHHAQARLNIMPGDKKGHLRIEAIFVGHDTTERAYPISELMTAFCFEEGKLGVFRKKTEAYEFIEKIYDYSQTNDTSFKRLLLGSSEKREWLEIIDTLFEDQLTQLYDPQNHTLIEYESNYLRVLLLSFIKHFGAMFYRFASFEPEARRLVYNVSTTTIFEGLSAFYQEMSLYGIEVFYDRNQMAKWTSRVRFERRTTNTKWFDLELNVSSEDLEIIKKANLETGIAVTKSGLVLLSNEQKDLLRFMKKYTKYEAMEDEEQDQTASKDVANPEEEDFKKFILPFNRARIFELFELRKLGVEGALSDDEIALCERLANLEEVPQYEVPGNLNEIMRPYQKIGYNWLRFLHENKLGACLADDMGLGKTLQAIAFIQSIYEQVDKILIVCPVSILLNWENEFKKFSDISVQIYHGGDREITDETKIILTSYGVMKKEADGVFSDQYFDLMILDEVQHLKNIRSLGAYAARKIQADFRICLTGTPVENDLAEFYNILDLSIPGIWGDLQFVKTTSNTKGRLLARKTASPFILRRTKTQVLTDLPPKIENNTILEMSEKERESYVLTLQQIKTQIQSSHSKKKYGEILRGLLKLRQLCLWQSLDNAPSLNHQNVRSTKIDFLLEMLEQILEEGHQAIVFSQFTTYLDLMQQFIEEKHWKFSRIDGSQSMKKRQSQVEQFQSGKTPIFLISLKAGGVGLNLTAASYVFIMDPWWNPAVEQQAIDRAHRIGQENPLNVYRPIMKSSVEEKVLELQEMKKQLFMDLLPEDDDNLFSGKLSMKDFEHLFS